MYVFVCFTTASFFPVSGKLWKFDESEDFGSAVFWEKNPSWPNFYFFWQEIDKIFKNKKLNKQVRNISQAFGDFTHFFASI